MEESNGIWNLIMSNIYKFVWKCLFGDFFIGLIFDYIVFIMDGNWWYVKRYNLEEGVGYKLGYMVLMLMFKYCYELNVKYVIIYVFSIDNFKRWFEEVEFLMEFL